MKRGLGVATIWLSLLAMAPFAGAQQAQKSSDPAIRWQFDTHG
jgi:hypothetical protein